MRSYWPTNDSFLITALFACSKKEEPADTIPAEEVEIFEVELFKISAIRTSQREPNIPRRAYAVWLSEKLTGLLYLPSYELAPA